MSKGWDSGMLKKLKSLVGKGLSTAEMGKKLGLSKNAVVGKLNRLGWNSKASDVKETKSTKTKNAPKSAKATAKKSEPKAKKAVAKKVVAKKVALKQKPATKVATPKKVAKKADSKPAKTAKKEVVVEKTAIKTASKKTKKDLALHELLIQHALQMANLKPNQCRWPIGDPDSDNFHFCGETVFSGKPYCYEHCRQAYQFTPAKKNK